MDIFPFLKIRKDLQLYTLYVNHVPIINTCDYETLFDFASALCKLSRFEGRCCCAIISRSDNSVLARFEPPFNESEQQLYKQSGFSPIDLDRLSGTFDWSRRHYTRDDSDSLGDLFDSLGLVPVESDESVTDSLMRARRIAREDCALDEIRAHRHKESRLDVSSAGSPQRCHYVTPSIVVHSL